MKKKNNEILDCIPHCCPGKPNTLLKSDLKIIDFQLYLISGKHRHYFVPVYILTDIVFDLNFKPCYETMVRLGYMTHDYDPVFLDYQDRCYSKLEAYKQHKMIFKKLQKGFFDNEILDKIREVDNVMQFSCQ